MKPRVKTHQMPGDVPKQVKQAMLEGRHPDKNRSRAFKSALRARERAVLKERTQREVEATMKKPCGHAAHPEDGNFGVRPKGQGPHIERGTDVEAHRSEPGWFVGKFVKLAFATGRMPGEFEYMWVEVQGVTEVHELRGVLKNTPLRCKDFTWGEELTFSMDEILDVYDSRN